MQGERRDRHICVVYPILHWFTWNKSMTRTLCKGVCSLQLRHSSPSFSVTFLITFLFNKLHAVHPSIFFCFSSAYPGQGRWGCWSQAQVSYGVTQALIYFKSIKCFFFFFSSRFVIELKQALLMLCPTLLFHMSLNVIKVDLFLKVQV